MKRLFLLSLTAILLVAAVGCASGRRAYTKGDYLKSVQQAVSRLQQNPSHKQSKDILYFAYPELLKYYGDRINTLKTGSDALRWDKVMDMYGELNGVYDQILRCPAAKKIVEPKSFQKEYSEARRNAADAHYASALQYMNLKDRNSLKTAYGKLGRVLELNPQHPDAAAKRGQLKEDLTIHVFVQPIPMHSQMFSLSNEFFENQLFDYFRRNSGEFVEFHAADYRGAEPDQFLVMRFDDFNVGQTLVQEKNEERKAQVVISKTKIKDSVVNVYGEVTAKVKLVRKTISSGGLLDVKVVDAQSNAVLSQQKFPGTFVWEDRFGMFVGDERALTDEDKSYTRNRESPNPPPQQLFVEFTKPIFQQVTGFIGNYYRNF